MLRYVFFCFALRTLSVFFYLTKIDVTPVLLPCGHSCCLHCQRRWSAQAKESLVEGVEELTTRSIAALADGRVALLDELLLQLAERRKRYEFFFFSHLR